MYMKSKKNKPACFQMHVHLGRYSILWNFLIPLYLLESYDSRFIKILFYVTKLLIRNSMMSVQEINRLPTLFVAGFVTANCTLV